MDYLRSCYTTTARLGLGQEPVEICWQWCSDGARDTTQPHWASNNWLDYLDTVTGPGEVQGSPRTWNNGVRCSGPLVLHDHPGQGDLVWHVTAATGLWETVGVLDQEYTLTYTPGFYDTWLHIGTYNGGLNTFVLQAIYWDDGSPGIFHFDFSMFVSVSPGNAVVVANHSYTSFDVDYEFDDGFGSSYAGNLTGIV